MEPNQPNLMRAVIDACRARGKRTKLADSTGVSLAGGDVLLRALVLRRILHKQLGDDERNVALMLPPTVAGVVANLAVALDRRVSVNLNYTLSNELINQTVRAAGVRHIITSRRVMERFPFEFEREILYLEDLRTLPSPIDKATAAFEAKVLGTDRLMARLGLDRVGQDDLLTILFSSGSTGEPKGIMLSHGNVASNAAGVDERVGFTPDDVLLGALPFFHSFGMLATLWMVLMHDLTGVYHTNPLDAQVIGDLAREHRATILLGTPSFMRLYERRCEPADFASVNVAITGAEHLPTALCDDFERKFGTRPTAGYGATETSPVVSVNIPRGRWKTPDADLYREGTVGKPIPRVRVLVRDRETGDELPPGSEGILWVTGPNIMMGYLDRPDLTAKVVRDGWYNTGDVAIIDEDGFITITGRESQFAKIAGEMVPHLLVEAAIATALECQEGSLSVAVTSVPDRKRGERLVVVHTPMAISPDTVRDRLVHAGLPPLYVPATDGFLEVEQLPMLGSGKLDLRQLKLIASAAFNADGVRADGR